MRKFSYLIFLIISALFISHQCALAEDYSLSIKKNSGKEVWAGKLIERFLESLTLSPLTSLFMIPIDAEDLKLVGCSNFNDLTFEQKKAFYIVFFAAIAERESDFKPEDKTYDHYHNNMNIGLMQIDKHSAIRHAFEVVGKKVTNSELKDPVINFTIGAFILKNQLEGFIRRDTQGKLFPNKIFYWDVLSLQKRQKFLKSFNNNKENLPFCEAKS